MHLRPLDFTGLLCEPGDVATAELGSAGGG
jgi:hypothetical protein